MRITLNSTCYNNGKVILDISIVISKDISN